MSNRPRHKLTDKNPENKTAVCSVCGPVTIYNKSKGSWACSIAVRTYREEFESTKKYFPWRQYKKSSCERCGFIPEDKCQLDVDHINGRDMDDPHNESNLQTLCANCHRLKTHQPGLFFSDK